MVNGVAMKKCVEKKRKGFSLPEILVACAIMVALSAAAFFGFNQAQQTRKMKSSGKSRPTRFLKQSQRL